MMTPREAIDTLKIAMAEVEWNYPFDYAVAMEMAIKALEKEIPMKPFLYDSEFLHFGNCPRCQKSTNGYDDWKICKNCGQKLDWDAHEEKLKFII